MVDFWFGSVKVIIIIISSRVPFFFLGQTNIKPTRFFSVKHFGRSLPVWVCNIRTCFHPHEMRCAMLPSKPCCRLSFGVDVGKSTWHMKKGLCLYRLVHVHVMYGLHVVSWNHSVVPCDLLLRPNPQISICSSACAILLNPFGLRRHIRSTWKEVRAKKLPLQIH